MLRRRYQTARRGASLAEYGLLAGLVAVGAIFAVQSAGVRVGGLMNAVASGLDGVEGSLAERGSEPSDANSASRSGAMILSAGAYAGDFSGLSGADALCRQEASANDWRGKSGFSLDQIQNASAFLCDGATCRSAAPKTEYVMAVAGDPGAGGHAFTTDSAGRGPGDAKDWSAPDAFGASVLYWSNRGPGAADLWPDAPSSATGATCAGWTDGSSSAGGYVGRTNTTNEDRWYRGGVLCNAPQRLVCLVD